MKANRHVWIAVCGVLVFASVVSLSVQSATQKSKSRKKKPGPSPNFVAHKFTPSCDSPSYPTPAPQASLGIDAACDLPGSGGAEANQNKAKNNFCASGTPKEMTIADLKKLQTTVNNDKSINFGDANSATRKKGPTVDRSKLEDLGEGTLVTIKAYVLIARQEGAESVNCGHNVTDDKPFHDIHISLVDSPKTTLANECKSVVAEMSPHHRPDEWTQVNVEKAAKAKAPVRVTGQLFFDSSHVPCSRGQAVRSNPKRVALWEIHPIYKFEVCTDNCDGAGTWVPLDQWAKQQ